MSDWNEGVIAEFRANEGNVGGYFKGAPMILLHHIGARSGTVRVTPLVYFPQDDATMVIVASKAGAPTNPDWYHNVVAHPEVSIEVGTERLPVRASVAEGAERDRLYAAQAALMPGFAEYERQTTRRIPVVILEPLTP